MSETLRRTALFLAILLFAAALSGCARHRARTAFDEAEELVKAEQYDQALEKYVAATADDPSNMSYKLKLAAGRTRAAGHHIRLARELVREDRLKDAQAEYALARGLDPSLEVASVESRQVQNLLEARTLVEDAFARYREQRYPAARQILADVLKREPQNARGLELLALLDSRPRAVVVDGVELDMSSAEPITLRFRQTGVREAFAILGKLSGINFILDEEVKGKTITVQLENGTFSQALELILQVGGVERKVLNSKTLLVYPSTKDKAKQYQDQLIQTFYLSHIDAKKAINLLRTMLQLRKVYVHEERNALVIRDAPETIRLAEMILKAADRADSEVLFDVEVLAVQDSDELKFGPKVNPYQMGLGFSKNETNIVSGALNEDGTTTGLIQSLNGLEAFYTLPSVTFDLAKTLNTSELLASPKIRVKNNEKAKIHIGNKDPIVTTTTVAGESTQLTQNVQYVDSGIKLDIEPNIQLDGTVLAKITLEVSAATRLKAATGQSEGEAPVALQVTNAQTSLVLVDGVRTILGGLYETNTAKNKSTIPWLGEIPFLGSLLTSHDNSKTRRELLLSITPHVVKRVEVPEAEVATIWSGGEESLAVGPKFGAFARPLVSEVEAPAPAAAPAAAPRRAAPPTGQMPAQPAPPGESPAASAAAPAVPAPVPAATQEPPAPAVAPQPAAGEESAPAQVPAAEESGEAAEVPAAPVMLNEVPVTPAAPTAVPAGPPRLDLAAPATTVVGQLVAVEVRVSEVAGLVSAPLFVKYDPALLEFVAASEGTFLGSGGQRTVFSANPGGAGMIVVGVRQAEGGAGASGGGVLYTLSFRAKAAGSAEVGVNRMNFRGAAGTQIPLAPAATAIVIR